MVVGGAATVVSLLALAWVKEMTGGLLGLFGVDPTSSATQTVVIVLATILMYCLDFSVNTGRASLCLSFPDQTQSNRGSVVQAGIRCFIVDNAPSHQQESANAWASRLTGVGNILGYIFGYMDLPKYFPFLGNTQFKVLCALASFSLTATLLVSCLYIKERDPRLEGPPSSGNPGVVTFFRQVFKSVKHLPPEIAKVCEVQLAAWVGWFPFLFYSTTYIGQLFVNPIFEGHPGLSDDDINKAWEEATRIGTFALLVYAIVSFVTNLTLPILVVPTYKSAVPPEPIPTESQSEEEPFLGSRRVSTSSAGTAMDPPADISGIRESKFGEGREWLSRLQIPGFTLRRAWLLSHILFAICMFSTFFIYSYQAATAVIGIVGISWALTLWAPFALISAEVSRIDTERRIRRHQTESAVSDAQLPNGTTGPISDGHDLENGSATPAAKAGEVEEEENLAQAGIILGLHNVAISAPQIISSLLSSAIFKAFQKPRGEPWDDSVGWVMRFGGCAAVLAAVLTSRLAEGARKVTVSR